MIAYKYNKSRLLNGYQCILLTFIHECKPNPGQPLLGLWGRGDHRGLQCRALVQAAQLDFGLPTHWAHSTRKLRATLSISSTVPKKYTPARQPVTLRYCLTVLLSGHSGLFRWKKSGKKMSLCKIDLMVHCSGLDGVSSALTMTMVYFSKPCSNEGLWTFCVLFFSLFRAG